MLFLVIVITSVSLALLSYSYAAFRKPSIILAALILVLTSGMRDGGLDYQQYQYIITAVRLTGASGLNFTERLLDGKDPLMILLVDFSTHIFGLKMWPIFLLFSTISVVSKVIASYSLDRFACLFIGLYAIFLSPGLEFAAIRAATGVGLVLLVVSSSIGAKPKIVLWGLAVISHVSIATLVPTVLMNALQLERRKVLILSAILALTTLIFSQLILSIARLHAFSGNEGSVFAVAFPIATLLILNVQLKARSASSELIYNYVAVATGIALGLSIPSVTIAFRVLELGWVLMLYAIVRDWATHSIEHASLAKVNAAAFFLLLTLANIRRGTWSALLELSIS